MPADTLWVDILRFSTDGGRCWHNIPLTPSYKPASEDENADETTQSPPVQQHSTMSPDAVSLQTSTSFLLPMEEETVVFTGLVTEPGGRAMTVAVYGYGTVSQRWRVAVVDFANNGFITKNCKFATCLFCIVHLGQPVYLAQIMFLQACALVIVYPSWCHQRI